jgi:Zn-dependent peptidase ImmA (M78 family)
MLRDKQFSSASELLRWVDEEAFPISLPIDVDRIAKIFEIRVKEVPTLPNKEIIGEILFSDEENRPSIFINLAQNRYEPRRRFTLAHELAHFFLHSNSSKAAFVDTRKTMSRSVSFWDVYESEANNFAANLLMPGNMLADEISKVIDHHKKITDGSSGIPESIFIDLMARRFAVSNQAMEYRLKNFKLQK